MGRLKTNQEREAKKLRKKQEEIKARREAAQAAARLKDPVLPIGNQQPLKAWPK